MFTKSILAGIAIAIGGVVNLSLGGGIAGAIFFSVGLLTVLHFQFALFTGKAGLFVDKQITIKELFVIWAGNFIGTGLVATAMMHIKPNLIEAAQAIADVRIANPWYTNLILGIFCGVLMYFAVDSFKGTYNPIFAMLPVSVFILAGFNHCVADMFYFGLAGFSYKAILPLLLTTLGNWLGCNLIPAGRKLAEKEEIKKKH